MKKSMLILGLAAAALSACGKQAALERPQPLGGAARDRDYDSRRPVTPEENIDPGASNRSSRAEPIPGTNDPIGRPPSLTP